MSDADSTQSFRTTCPRMSRPRIPRAFSSASAGLSASFTPPALPRPPVSTWAFTTTGPPIEEAAARASSGETARRPSETGIPTRLKSSLPWYSYRSTAADSNDPAADGRSVLHGTFRDRALHVRRHPHRRLRAGDLGCRELFRVVAALRRNGRDRRRVARGSHQRGLTAGVRESPLRDDRRLHPKDARQMLERRTDPARRECHPGAPPVCSSKTALKKSPLSGQQVNPSHEVGVQPDRAPQTSHVAWGKAGGDRVHVVRRRVPCDAGNCTKGSLFA